MIERTIYECEHCHKRRLINKSAMKKHEGICWYNNKNKTCLTCSGYVYEPPYLEPHPELDGCPNEHIDAIRYCEYEDKNLDAEPVINCEHWRERD
ncbi:hypothetical protein [Clostridium beijerinckii]|uniref:hypothetical protein n=1 Tax=Clostridium beijerinckii TaxID=1520 RepID=UPI00047DB33D|nr:hypothetical protein [Clostridium beijerinckii]